MKKNSGNKNTVVINVPVETEIWSQIGKLSEKYGVSSAFIVRRALAYTVQTGHVHWPTDNSEAVAHEKFGPATPVYDAEEVGKVKDAGIGKKVPANRAE